ncbi:MAG: hypothetical protein ABUK01_15020 [Leptospirales bacterium]
MKSDSENIIVLADTSTQYLCLTKAKIGRDGFSDASTTMTIPDKQITDWFSNEFMNFIQPEGKSKIGALAIGKGPGSFTGLRISFSYLRTFAMFSKVPLISFSSGRLWQKSLCRKNELLLTRLNKDLYSGYLPGVHFKAAMSVDNWQEYLKVNPELKAAIWDKAMHTRNHTSSHTVWPDQTRMVSEPEVPNELPLSFKEMEHANTATVFDALPDYGHDIILNKSEKKSAM